MSSPSSRIKENKPFAALRLFASPMFFQAIVFKNELTLKQNQKNDKKTYKNEVTLNQNQRNM